MKAKTIAKRLRARSDYFHGMALTVQDGDKDLAVRHRLVADVLQEVADQVAPRPKKEKKRLKKEAKKVAKAKEANNTHNAKLGLVGWP